MSDSIALCIVGAGSSYTPELITGILNHSPDELPVHRIALTDIDPGRLGVMSGWSRRAVAAAGRDIEISDGTDLEAMLDGAGFVITQIRVGGMQARLLDETIPLKYGVIGQETTGPGGMFKALRTVPAMIEVARAVERVTPDAFILNYTNPSGIVTEAVENHTGARFIGLCSGIPAIRKRLAAKLAGRYPDLRMYCVGLNHLGFIHRILSGERDVTGEAIRFLLEQGRAESADNAARADLRLAAVLGAVPIGYVQYYFDRKNRLEHARSAPKTRAEQVMEIEAQVLAEAADEGSAEKPAGLKKRGGGGYSDITFSFMKAIHFDKGDELVCSTLNRGAVDGIDDRAAVEIVCRVDRQGAHPLPVGPIPPAFRGLVQAVKAYETLTVEGAVTRRKRPVLQALLNHPLVGDLAVAEPLIDELCTAHRLSLEED